MRSSSNYCSTMRRCSAITSAVRVLQTESRSQVLFFLWSIKKCSTRRMSWEAMRVWREAKRERFVFKIVVAQSENKPTSDHSMHWTIAWLKNYVWLFFFFLAMVDYCTQVKNIQREEFGSCASSGGEVRIQQVELERIALRWLFFFAGGGSL